MPVSSGHEPIDDDELLYRKIPVSMKWYDEYGVEPVAFRPRKDETTGISLDREKYRSPQEAAQGRSPDGYWVAVLRVGDLRNEEIEVVPNPIEGNPGHVLLPGINYIDKKKGHVLSWMELLAKKLTLRVEGPFT